MLAGLKPDLTLDWGSGLMNFEEFLGETQADVAEEVVGAVGKAGEAGEDGGTEGGEIVGPGVEMQDLLLEEAPELLDRVEPGRIGGQAHQLNGEMQPPRAPRGGVGHARGADPGPGPRLGLQRGEHIGQEVDRPVVQDEVQALGGRILAAELLIERDEPPDPDAAGLQHADLPGEGIERPDHAGGRIAAVAAPRERLRRPRGPIGGGEGGLPIVGQLVAIEEDQAVRGGLHFGQPIRQVLPLGGVVRVRTVEVVAPTFPMDVQPVEHAPDARQGVLPQPVTDAADGGQRPAALRLTELPGLPMHLVDQRRFLLGAGRLLGGEP
jgi:hypothetical protein